MIARIEAIPHEAYAEPFVGMGGIFLRRRMKPKAEAINDWSDDVANFFRILQHHYIAFMDMLRFQITGRVGFEKLLAQEASSLTDLQRAARFLYLQRLAFGGKVQGKGFGVSPLNAARFDVTKLAPMLGELHERLAGVVIEHLPWAEFIRRYDRSEMLFYLDPPYYGCENDYGAGMFERSEFETMAEVLRGIKGKFLLSINDNPDIRRIFTGFDIEPVSVRYTIAGMDKDTMARELLISG